MKNYVPIAHQLYPGQSDEIIHFNEETLDLTELTELHKSLLSDFQNGFTTKKIIAKYPDPEEAKEAIEELIELGLIAESKFVQYMPVVDLSPQVHAFRIVLTEQCNLRCVECFVTKNQDKLRTMPPDILERVAYQSIPYGAKNRLTYHFFGGEPLLRFDYIQKVVEIAENAVKEGKMIRPLYTITTNATLLNEEILEFFIKHDFKVGVSIDGPKEANDKLRVYISGKGTFDDVARNYDRLVAANIDTHILITPHPDFIEQLPDFFSKIVSRFPMKTITINTPLHADTLHWTVEGKQYAKTLVQLMELAKQMDISIDSAASPPLAALAANIRREGPCALICDKIMASVGPDGSMSFCSQKWHPYLSVPSLEAGKDMRTPIRRASECVTCEAKHICGGPCPALQKISGETLDENKCDFMRALLPEVAKNLTVFEAVE